MGDDTPFSNSIPKTSKQKTSLSKKSPETVLKKKRNADYALAESKRRITKKRKLSAKWVLVFILKDVLDFYLRNVAAEIEI